MHDIGTDNGLDRLLIMMKCSKSYGASITKAVATSLAVIALLAGFALVSTTNAIAEGPGPITVLGYVYDNMGDPLEGASVVVTNEDTLATDSTTTDEFGFYQIDFDAAQMNIDDTVRVDTTYSGAPATNNTVLTSDMFVSGYAQVDVHYLTEIPEFGSLFGVLLVSIMIGAVALLSSRRKRD
jgi:hypothetical protein